MGVIRRSPELCSEVLAGGSDTIPEGKREAYCRLCAHWRENDFHCAHAVLRHLAPEAAPSSELLDGTSAFLGGSALLGRTCSALTAGVMALGLALGNLERSRFRVLRLIATMAAGGDPTAENLNAFNRTVNLGHRLACWFTAQYGSTQCREITKADFGSEAGVSAYIEGNGMERCRALARRVAAEVRTIIGAERIAKGFLG
jgi:hypothetical protein